MGNSQYDERWAPDVAPRHADPVPKVQTPFAGPDPRFSDANKIAQSKKVIKGNDSTSQ